jgi:glycosidase
VARDYETRSVALQTEDPDSLLSHYRNLIHLRDNHEALRIGEWSEVKTVNSRVYAALRYTENEIMLVVINLSSQEQTDYALTLEEGPLSGEPTATLLMGEGEITAPTITESGGFTDYKPLSTLPPHSTTIIQLTP